MSCLRHWIKSHLPYPVVTAIARAINPPFLADIQRCERLDEYAWVLKHVQGPRIVDVGYAGSYFAQMLTWWGEVTGVDPRDTPHIQSPYFRREWPWVSTGYDTAVCVSVLEHDLDRRKELEEAVQGIVRRLTTTDERTLRQEAATIQRRREELGPQRSGRTHRRLDQHHLRKRC